MKFNSNDEFEQEDEILDPDEGAENDEDEDDMNDLWEDCIFPDDEDEDNE